jgi:hypothetical protein
MSGGFVISLSALNVSAVAWKNISSSVVELVFWWCIDVDADDRSATELLECMSRGLGTDTTACGVLSIWALATLAFSLVQNIGVESPSIT